MAQVHFVFVAVDITMKSILALLVGVVLASDAVASGAVKSYCPSQNDLTIAYVDHHYPAPQLRNQGWHIKGGGGVASMASFNLLGGYVEFDVDLGNVQNGVNANVYAISPKEFHMGMFDKQSDYCDGAGNGTNYPFCLEVDWLEANGHCGAAMTIHAIQGPGKGCTAWGCRTSYYLKSTKYRMRIEYSATGRVNVFRNGNQVDDLYPTPGADIWEHVVKNNVHRGSVIYSSEWVGWVPHEDCGRRGNLGASSFTVSNLVVHGSVVRGPVPAECSNQRETRRRRSAPVSRRRRSRANCADDTHDCRKSACCQDASKTCYEKNSGWASCRDTGSCRPGSKNPYDPPGSRTPWTCRAITTSTRRRSATRRRRSRAGCTDDTHDCRRTGCCQDPSKSCYEKDGGWASCRDTGSCKSGSINPYDPPNARTPWTCRRIHHMELSDHANVTDFVV